MTHFQFCFFFFLKYIGTWTTSGISQNLNALNRTDLKYVSQKEKNFVSKLHCAVGPKSLSTGVINVRQLNRLYIWIQNTYCICYACMYILHISILILYLFLFLFVDSLFSDDSCALQRVQHCILIPFLYVHCAYNIHGCILCMIIIQNK